MTTLDRSSYQGLMPVRHEIDDSGNSWYYLWHSICSKHLDHDSTCRLCITGSWVITEKLEDE